MIDFHNHIIPNVDDGSKSIEMSLSMLQKAAQTGITKVVTTTHYNHPYMKERFPNFEIINSKLSDLKKEMIRHKIDIEICSKAEVYFNESIVDFITDKNIIINNKYMLIEFDFNFLPKNYEKILFNLQVKGITPIIAHPERYKFVQKDYNIIKDWINKDYVLQISCGSILKHFGLKTFATTKKIIDNGDFHLAGSDAHSNLRRNFCLKEFLYFIKKNSNPINCEILMDNANSLFSDDKLSKCKPLNKHSIFDFFKR